MKKAGIDIADVVQKSPAQHVELDSPQQSTDSPLDEEQPYAQINFATIMAFLAICTQLNAYELALLVPSTTLSYINADLGPSPSYPWITISWTLGASVLVSVAGRLSDIFGRRYFMLCGAFIGFIGTIIGATGQSINQMIASGVVLGIGSGFQEMGFACFLEFVPNKYRIMFTGFYGMSAIVALLGPMVAYAFIDHTSISWRGAYWYMCAWHGCAGIFLWYYYRPPTFNTKHQNDYKTKLLLLKEMDYVGLLLFTAACILFLVGIGFGGRQYHWSSAHVISPLVAGVVAFIILGLWEAFATLRYPLFPPKLFRQFRGFIAILGVAFLCGMLYYSMQVLWPQESGLLFVPADDTLIRGAYAMITPFGTWVSVSSVALIFWRLHHERWQVIFFLCAQTALIGSLASVGVEDKAQAIATVFILSCLINQPLYMLFSMLSFSIDDQADIGVALGVMSTFRLLGGAIATAVYSAILTTQFQSKLPGAIARVAQDTGFPLAHLPELIKAAALNNAKSYKSVPGLTPQVLAAVSHAIRVTYTQCYKVVYLAALAFGAVGIACALCTRSIPMSKKNNQKAVLLENEKKPEAPAPTMIEQC